MSKTFRDWEPDQVWLPAPSLQDLVPAGHVAYSCAIRCATAWIWRRSKERRLAKIRLAKIREAEAALEAEAQAAAADKPSGRGKKPPGTPAGKACPGVRPGAQRNFTDPQSRIMKTRDGFIQGFNAPAAVDATAQVIAAPGRESRCVSIVCHSATPAT